MVSPLQRRLSAPATRDEVCKIVARAIDLHERRQHGKSPAARRPRWYTRLWRWMTRAAA